ncbi:MAG: phosphocholine cytidylyltransferase family protein [Gemmatimonadota bacterium]
MRAIILAAGAGTRLSPLTDGFPKCLVKLGGQALLDYQVRALRGVGVDDLVLVVGYEAEQIRRHCGTGARYVENRDYATTNSIYSLYLACGELDRESYLLNCDIIFDPRVLPRLVSCGHPNAIAVDSTVALQSGEMNVRLTGQRVTAIGKDLDPAQAQAQSVQLVRFDAAGARLVRDEVERLVRGEARNAFPTSAYGPLIADGALFGVEVGDLTWTEIDTLADYDRAAQKVLPRLGSDQGARAIR